MTYKQAKQRLNTFKSNASFFRVSLTPDLIEAIDLLCGKRTTPTSENIGFDWDCLPKWADKWIAMDSNKYWNCYYERPEIHSGNYWWIPQYTIMTEIPTTNRPHNFTGDWKQSLFLNPKYK